MIQRFAIKIGILVVAVIYWFYSRTWRVKHICRPRELDGQDGVICGHWHGDELLLVGVNCFSRMGVLSSWSRDGGWMAGLLTLLGYSVVRGSSSRGGAAGLKGLIDLVRKKNLHATLAVDGPRGPLYKVKPGIIKLAEGTRRPIILGCASAKYRYIFKRSWNQCFIPYPFSRCVVVYSQPIYLPDQMGNDEFESFRLLVEQKLLALKEEADHLFQRDFLISQSHLSGRSAVG